MARADRGASSAAAVAARILAAALAAGSACAPALREPPPLLELAGLQSAPPAATAAERLAEAQALLAKRQPAAARTAARLGFEAAVADPDSTEPLATAAQALVWVADHDVAAEERREAATRAVYAAQWCKRREPTSPRCDYWLGAALGVQARERRATGLSALAEIEAAFQRAADAAPGMDAAAPDRALALFYVRAPGWPTGPGDPDRGLEHARRALELAPDHPPNHLVLAEALREVGRREEGRAAAERALELAAAAAAAGAPDAAEWVAEARAELAGRR